MRFPRVGLVLAAVLLCFRPGPRAFSSLEFYGGAYHQQVTHAALEPLGIREPTLHWLDLGNLEADKFYGPLFEVKHMHFTDMTFDESEDDLEDRLEKVVDLSEHAVDDYQIYRQSMVEFGIYLHSAQDFYSHTNWVEKHLLAGATEIPLAPKDFDDLPSGLVSPYSLLRRIPPGEVTEAETYEEAFKRPFYRSEELAGLEGRQRIRAAAEAQEAFTHYDLAKDNPTYLAGQARWNPQGRTVFEMALEAATRETVRQWKHLEREIEDEHEEEAPAILAVLREGWLSSFPDSSEKAELSIPRGELNLRRDLTIDVDLVLTTTVWNRDAAQKAIDIYTGLTRPEDEEDDIGPRASRTCISIGTTKSRSSVSFTAPTFTAAPGAERV